MELRDSRRELLAVVPVATRGCKLGASPHRPGVSPAAAEPQPRWTGNGLDR